MRFIEQTTQATEKLGDSVLRFLLLYFNSFYRVLFPLFVLFFAWYKFDGLTDYIVELLIFVEDLAPDLYNRIPIIDKLTPFLILFFLLFFYLFFDGCYKLYRLTQMKKTLIVDAFNPKNFTLYLILLSVVSVILVFLLLNGFLFSLRFDNILFVFGLITFLGAFLLPDLFVHVLFNHSSNTLILESRVSFDFDGMSDIQILENEIKFLYKNKTEILTRHYFTNNKWVEMVNNFERLKEGE